MTKGDQSDQVFWGLGDAWCLIFNCFRKKLWKILGKNENDHFCGVFGVFFEDFGECPFSRWLGFWLEVTISLTRNQVNNNRLVFFHLELTPSNITFPFFGHFTEKSRFFCFPTFLGNMPIYYFPVFFQQGETFVFVKKKPLIYLVTVFLSKKNILTKFNSFM